MRKLWRQNGRRLWAGAARLTRPSPLSPSGKGKRWKNLYFILEGNDAQLIYFESEKRATKPKGLIDLSVCSVYGVHDSLFGRLDVRSWLLSLTRGTFRLHKVRFSKLWGFVSSRPNCFQVVVQHFSEEQYIFYFAGEASEHAQVIKAPSIPPLTGSSKMKALCCGLVPYRPKNRSSSSQRS